MSITIQNSIMVRPSKETPNEAIWLTDVDLIKRTPYSHTPFVYFYPYHKNNSNNNNSTFSNFFDSTLLKTSLSEVLVAFYPVAGRLRRNNVTGRIEIDCNAKGVLFVEAKTTSFELSDLGEFTPIDMLYKLLIPSCDYSGDLANIPLMMVQLTRFRCGGICIGLGVHHFVGDGTAYIYLVSQWARLTRGVGLAALPVFDRASILSPRRQPPQLKFDHIEFQRHHTPSDSQQDEATKVGVFKFTKHQIIALKKQASEIKHSFSTFEIVAAHVWRCALIARFVKNDELVRFCTPKSGRPHFKHIVMPERYFCNFIFISVYIAKAGEIVSRPLWYVASKVHEAVIRMDEEYMKSAIDFLSLQSDPTVFATGPHSSRCPDIHVVNWRRLPYHEADFGWGKPVYIRHVRIGYEGQAFIMPSENEDDLVVAIKLFSNHMDRFERIIYDFDHRRSAL